jgi:hypothetical protein
VVWSLDLPNTRLWRDYTALESGLPVSDIDTAAVESLKALDPKRPIREADIAASLDTCRPLTINCSPLRFMKRGY